MNILDFSLLILCVIYQISLCLRFRIHIDAITVMITPSRKLRLRNPANSRLEWPGAGQLTSGAGLLGRRLK